MTNSLSVSIIESLLYEDEGATLDFKREQYKFDGASNTEKSELLKDLLAFANSWRRSTAYILIGVIEINGGRSEIVGISPVFDDAKLQQFVNSKTNRPLIFAYRTFSLEGKSVGVIEIPVQERPLYLTSDFGKLKKEKVYVRRGSSTAIATPDEIARMGRSPFENSPSKLCLDWADLERRIHLPSPCYLEAKLLEPRLPNDTFDNHRSSDRRIFLDSFSNNKNYSIEIIEYTFCFHLLRELGFRLRNDGETVARRVCFVGRVKNNSNVIVRDWEDRPIPPHWDTRFSWHENITPPAKQILWSPNPSVQTYNGYCEITIEFGDVRPSEEIWTITPILVGAVDGGVIQVDGELRGNNLPSPVSCKLEVRIEVERRPMNLVDVQQSMEKNDPE